MQDYIARQPIMNGKAQACAYRLALGRSLRDCVEEVFGDSQHPGQSTSTAFTDICGSLTDQKTAYIDFFDGLMRSRGFESPNEASDIVVVFGKEAETSKEICAQLRAQGYRLAFDSGFFQREAPETALSDVMIVDFTSVSLSAQSALIRKYKGKVTLLANKIETWGDFKIAKDMGYDIFQGYFFLWPAESLIQGEIKSLDICLTGILQELEKPEPSFEIISEMIEHDLALSYKLLRLVNSAFMAPKYKIRSISQALTYLGTRELHQWISMLLMSGIRSEENAELVVMSLVRGKMMALIAGALQLAEAGSEPFLTGLFSLIDVILNREMAAVLSGLPLSDSVKSALLGHGNDLSELLSCVVGYEQAAWQKIEGKYPMNILTPQQMVSIYQEAHRWARLLDSRSQLFV